MPTSLYPIIEIKNHWILEQEQLGTKEKFWYKDPAQSQERAWLFKHPTMNTGQHWAEKIAYEIAKEMRILAPPVELAMSGAHKGSTTKSFTNSGYSLFHGNQLLAEANTGYNPNQKYNHRMHTLSRIFEALDKVFPEKHIQSLKKIKMAEYLVLDAIIGNVDRHHENWGILQKHSPGRQARTRLAPSFDHASSLGRELGDSGGKQNRQRYLNELGISKYCQRAHGAIFISEQDIKAPSPTELIAWAIQSSEYRDTFLTALKKVDLINGDKARNICSLIPSTWMTDISKEFVHQLIAHNICELHSLRS